MSGFLAPDRTRKGDCSVKSWLNFLRQTKTNDPSKHSLLSGSTAMCNNASSHDNETHQLEASDESIKDNIRGAGNAA